MKKLISLLLVIILVFTSLPAIAASTYAVSTKKTELHTGNDEIKNSQYVDWIKSPEKIHAITVNDKVNLSWDSVASAEYYQLYEKVNGNWKYLKQITNNNTYLYTTNGIHTYGISSIRRTGSGDYYESNSVTEISVYVFDDEDMPGKEDVIHNINFSGTSDKQMTIDVYDNTYLHIVTDSLTWLTTKEATLIQPDALKDIYFTSLGNEIYIKASKHIVNNNTWGLVEINTYQYRETIYNGQKCFSTGEKRAKLAITLIYHSGKEPDPHLFPVDFTGFSQYESGLFFVSGGDVVATANGLINDPNNSSDWYYCANGQVQLQYSGLAQYNGEWFYLENGKLNTTRVGIVNYDGGRFMIAAGRILREVNGLIRDPNTDNWYYVAAGQVVDYTGLAQYDDHWFYVINGRLATKFSGIVEYDGKKFEVSFGEVVQYIWW